MTKIQIKHAYKSSVESLFDAFLSVSSAQNFMFRTDSGKILEAKVDGEPGGSFLFIEERAKGPAAHYGTFVEVDRPSRLSFVFSTEPDAAESDFIELVFSKNGANSEIELSHEIRPEQLDMKTKIQQGWALILEKLDHYLSHQTQEAAFKQPKDSIGNLLSEGDSVKTIKDLKVKGSSQVIKRGTVVKKIHLIGGNDEEVDCRIDGVALSLETQWLAKI